MKLFLTLPLVLLSLATFVGCSTVDSSRPAPATGIKVQNVSEQAVQVGNASLSYEASYSSQKAELERLRAENEALKQARGKPAVDEPTHQRLVKYLEINDYLIENHDEVIKRFATEYAGKRDALFSAAGGSGKLLGFEVEDALVYKGYVFITFLFLWENADGSGGVGRCALSLDPDKDFDIAGCVMNAQMPVSRRDLAEYLRGGNADGASAEQLNRAGSQVHGQPAASGKPLMSDETKGKLIGAGIAVATAWLVHAINSSQ